MTARSIVERSERDPFYVTLAFDALDFGPGPQPDVRRLLDLIDEVLRHGVAQAIAAHDDLHFFRVARQIHRALAGRVSAADDEHAPAANAGASVVAAP